MDANPLPTRLQAEAIVALVTTVLFSIPSARHLLGSFAGKPAKRSKGVYADRDGQSTPEDVAKFSTFVPRALIAVFAVLGCSSSIYLSALDATSTKSINFVGIWVYSAAWVCDVRSKGFSLR